MGLAFPFVGRALEKARLQSCINSVMDGRGSLMLAGGEAGVGKTTLLQEVIAAADGCLTVIGRCPGPGETPAYGPWLEVIDRLRRDPGWETDSLPPPFGTAAGEWSPYELAGALGHWLGRHGSPLLAVIEDLHWADPATLDLTRHLTARLSEWPVAVVATYRTDELSRSHPLWTLVPELLRAGAERILLDRLTRADVAELVAATLPPDLSGPEVAELVHTRTAGLALFVREVLDAAARTGQVPGDGDPLPQTLRQAIDSKLDRLPPAAQEVLEAVAVVGERFSFDLLARVADLPEDGLSEALEAAVDRNVIRPLDTEGNRFAFDHALLRQALLARLIGTRRRRWHARIADALAAGPGADVDSVAFHLRQAGDPRAAEYLLAAGDRSLRLGALAQGAERYQEALALLPDGHDRRGELLLKLGWCLRGEDPARALTCWQEAAAAAAAAGDRPAAVWAQHMLLGAAVRSNAPGWPEQMAAVLAAQEELLPDPRYQRLEAGLFGQPAGYPRAGTMWVTALTLSGAPDEAQARYRELRARALSGTGSDILGAGMVLTLVSGRLAEAAQLCAQAAEAALRVRNYREAVQMRANQLYISLIGPADRPDEIDALAASVRELEGEAWQRTGYAHIRRGFSLTGVYQFFRGDWRGAQHHVVEAARQDPGANGGTLVYYAGRILLVGGDPAGARPFVEAVPPLNPGEPVALSNNFMVLAHALRAELYLALGDAPLARAWLEAAERWPALAAAPFYRASVRLSWAQYHRQTGNSELAWRAAADALTDARAAGSSLVAMQALRLMGELAGARGDAEAADKHFQAALELPESCRFSFDAALTRLARGRTLAGPAARADLEAACAYFAEIGAEPALAAARKALEAAGADPGRDADARPGATDGPDWLPDGLTAREAEVVGLVAQGLTDREIAARLFISRKTVDRHLRNIFNKAGVSNRAALAAYAARHGLAG